MKNIKFFIFLLVLVNSLMISGFAMTGDVVTFVPDKCTKGLTPPDIGQGYEIKFERPIHRDQLITENTMEQCQVLLNHKKALNLISWACWTLYTSKDNKRLEFAINLLYKIDYSGITQMDGYVENYNIKVETVQKFIILKALMLLRQDAVSDMDNWLIVNILKKYFQQFCSWFVSKNQYMQDSGFNACIMQKKELFERDILIPTISTTSAVSDLFKFALDYGFEGSVDFILKNRISTLSARSAATILNYAAFKNRGDIVKYLLTRVHKPGFDIINLSIGGTPGTGSSDIYSPLHMVVNSSFAEIVALFFRPNVQPAVDNGFMNQCSRSLKFYADRRREKASVDKNAVIDLLRAHRCYDGSSASASSSASSSSFGVMPNLRPAAGEAVSSTEGSGKGSSLGILAIPAVALTLAAAGGIGYLMTKKQKKEQPKKTEDKIKKFDEQNKDSEQELAVQPQ